MKCSATPISGKYMTSSVMRDYKERDFRVFGALRTSFHLLVTFSTVFSEVVFGHGREYTAGPTCSTI
jgi:hypothetical protein